MAATQRSARTCWRGSGPDRCGRSTSLSRRRRAYRCYGLWAPSRWRRWWWAAHREAAQAALGFLEERAALARVQSQGVRRRVGSGGWVVAGFVHRTSREGDPQLHTHCVVPNLVQRTVDGRHVAFDAGPLFEWARAAGSIYQNQLQGTLSRELGVAWGPDRNNTREIEGFTRAQLRAFSKRSAQIEAELEAKGAVYESPALRMQADDEASLATRTAKDHSLTPSLLAERWQREGNQVGLAAGADLDRAVCRADPRLEPPGWDEIIAALVDSEVGLCSRSARFTRPDVVEHICAISGRPAYRRGDHCPGRPVRRLRSGGTPNPRYRGGPAADRRSGRPPPTGRWRTAPWL